MNEMDVLARHGHVEPVDDTVLAAAVEAVLTAPPDRHRDRPGPRRHARRAVASAAAATAVVAAVTASTSGHARGPRLAPTGRGGASLVAFVTSRSIRALGAVTGYVEKAAQQDPGGASESWRTRNRFLDELPGRSAELITSHPDGSTTVLNIDYQHHTWYQDTTPPPATGSPAPTPANRTPLDYSSGQPSATAIADWFHQTGIKLQGTATIDGTPTFELSVPAIDPNGDPIAGETVTAWVDRSTYLPVRIARHTPSATGTDNGARVTVPAATAITDFSWEPATTENVTVFELTPPAGYQQIPDPALHPIPTGQ